MIAPYIVFQGECRDALEFYEKAFQSEATKIKTYGGYVPEGLIAPPPGLENWILHAEMQICGSKFWFADETGPKTRGNMMKLAVTVPTYEDAKALFDILSEEGAVTLAPTDTFYSAFHGAVTDKFGIEWNVVAEEAPIPGLV